MTPETDPVHLTRQVWQAVSGHALRAISKHELCPEQSRIENLRPVFLNEEDEYQYGKQLWCFEATGVSGNGRRQNFFGLMEFSVQYGLLEPRHSGLFENVSERDGWIEQLTCSAPEVSASSVSTRIWVWTAWASVAILSGGWLTALVWYVFGSPLTGNAG